MKAKEIVVLADRYNTYGEGTTMRVLNVFGAKVRVQLVQNGTFVVRIIPTSYLRSATAEEIQQYLRAAFDANVITTLKIAAENNALTGFAQFFRENHLDFLIERLLPAIKVAVLDKTIAYQTAQEFLAQFSEQDEEEKKS